MKKLLFLISILFFGSIAARNYAIVGYFANWSYNQKINGVERKPAFRPSSIPAKKLTHVNYAFVLPGADGGLIMTLPEIDEENFKEFQSIKKNNPNLNIILSVGGVSGAESFSKIAASSPLRKTFANNIIRFLKKYDLDGVDIDWEYPLEKDADNFTRLMSEIRSAFKKSGKHYLLTVAGPIAQKPFQVIHWKKIEPYIDWVNVMAYNYHFPINDGVHLTNHNAPLYDSQTRYSIDTSVAEYIDTGIPPQKIMLGVPFYGRRYTDTDNIYKTYTKPPSGTSLLYSNLRKNKIPFYQKFWDDEKKVPYLVSKRHREFISYEDERSLKEKIAYAKEKRLGGVMVWELSQDTFPEWHLLSTIANEMKKRY